MRTTKETVKENKEVVNEFNLKEAFVLWKNKAKSGNDYLSGYTEGDHEVEIKVTGDDVKATYSAKTTKIKIRISKR